MQTDHPGPSLREARRAAGLTQEELAELAKVRRTDLVLIEGGRRACGPKLAKKLRLVIERHSHPGET